METKELQLVSYEQAKRLQKLGFDWEFLYFYSTQYRMLLCRLQHDLYDDPAKYYVAAPTTALALKWLRDDHGIMGGILPSQWDTWFCLIRANGESWYLNDDKGATLLFLDYEAAESALLDALLTYVEETPLTIY